MREPTSMTKWSTEGSSNKTKLLSYKAYVVVVVVLS